MRRLSTGDHFVEPTAFGNWIRSPGVREAIESILIAVLLALLFRFFEAEAYVIPTGSMAPDLQGQHIDVVCPMCEFDYRAGASLTNGERPPTRVVCPICQYTLVLERNRRREHRPYSGDRILVNKFAYDFSEPKRFDVIVFKFPINGKQNFIKRLVGLPNEGMLIERGDIFTYDYKSESFEDRKIARKPADKLKSMLQMVDDTQHIAPKLIEVKWPSRWQQWDGTDNDSNWKVSPQLNQFTLANDSNETQWLRYRHLRPRRSDWKLLEDGNVPDRMKEGTPQPGELITDYYAYNDSTPGERFPGNVGLHWVGDLAIRANIDINSDSGNLSLELVEGVIKFRCRIDVASGKIRLETAGGSEIDQVTLTGETTFDSAIRGKGDHEILFANADDKLAIWIDDRLAGECEYSRTGNVVPFYSLDDPGDAEPVGIGGQEIDLQVNRLRVLRDIYYTSKNGTRERNSSSNFPMIEYTGIENYQVIHNILRQPKMWGSRAGMTLFDARSRDESYVFFLNENQLFPMGDNSPRSNDARIWSGARFVDRSYLLGKALFIYWPHAKTKPIPFWPNFGRMRFIR